MPVTPLGDPEPDSESESRPTRGCRMIPARHGLGALLAWPEAHTDASSSRGPLPGPASSTTRPAVPRLLNIMT